MTRFAHICLYINTIRYLRPSQVFWRVWRRLPMIPAPDAGAAPALRHSDQPLAAFPRKRPSLIGPDAFRFLNREDRIRSAADWNDPRADALWLYNLHYFDDLCADGAEARCAWHGALIARWIAENPAGHGCGWDPYPTSLRIVNWIKWALAANAVNVVRDSLLVVGSSSHEPRTTSHKTVGRGFSAPGIQSLAVQARYLAPRVEWHLLGNHVLANAKALVFAGCFFAGAEAEGWLRKGLKILGAQLAEQVLADGGHFERSPMYHAIVLEDLLDLINLSHSYPGVMPEKPVDVLRIAAAKMLHWLGVMTHPDGGIPFFNDAAFGVAANFVELSRYAERIGLSPPQAREPITALTRLAESGYIRMQQGNVTVIFDVAPVGPDYLPGHAHADTLSFELAHGAQRVICNSGTSCYGRTEMRHWERSTAAHNTVEIDGENSSEVWDGFRVARRAYPVGLSVSDGSSGAINPRPTGAPGFVERGTWVEQRNTYNEIVGRGFSAPQGSLRVACAHDGYARLRGPSIHRRTIELAEGALRWTDEITGKGAHRVVGRIPLHPSVRAERLSESAWKLALPLGENLVLTAAGVALNEERGRYSPEFGIAMERQVLVWVVDGPLPVTVTLQLVGSAR